MQVERKLVCEKREQTTNAEKSRDEGKENRQRYTHDKLLMPVTL